MNAIAPSRPSFRQVVLGLFIIGQLIFLPMANLCGLFQWAQPKLVENHQPLHVVHEITSQHGRMTGQVQNWRLFAPEVPTKAAFLTVELRWLGPPPRAERLPSFFEPNDPFHYLHGPGSGDRLFHYENRLSWPFMAWDRESVAQRPEEWQQYLADDVRRQGLALRAYLRWRMMQYQQEHPGTPLPDEAILRVRLYPTRAPGQEVSPDCVEMPLARWSPVQDGSCALPEVIGSCLE